MPEAETQKRLHIKTFGCQMNVYDSDRIAASLIGRGYRVEPELAAADVVLINTCSIRAKSEQKVLSLLGQLAPLKKRRPEMVIGVAGCVGQRMGRSLLQRVPHLDLVLGPDSVDRVPALVEEVQKVGKRMVDTQMDEPGRTYSQPVQTPVARPVEFLTIMKGCDHFCTYCIVPFVRGREKSRPIDEVVEDVRQLVARGTREVVFLGQNINTYGKGTPQTLAQLIEAVHPIQGLDRIRYVTSHPRDLGADLIAQFGSMSKLCPALHLPFQSGSNAVLKRMSRLYTREQYLGKVEALRQARPDIALSTDIIVGFPGETDDDFAQTLDLVRHVEFAAAFMFKYSSRPGTRAEAFADPVPERVKEERLRQLQDVVNPIIGRQNAELIGGMTQVLIEDIDRKRAYFSGRDPYAKKVHVLNAGQACVGKILDVEITEANASNLRGYYVGAPRIDRGSQTGLPAPVQVA